MSNESILSLILFYVCLALVKQCSYIVNAKPSDYPSATLSNLWYNSNSANNTVIFRDDSVLRAILLKGTSGPSYACGFYCRGDSCNFGIFIVRVNGLEGITYFSIPEMVWSASRNDPVKYNASLELTSDGDLVLKDADESWVWSTQTAGKLVAGMNLTEIGNLLLYNKRGEIVWQSFDYPTDTLVLGQKLKFGQKLIANVSSTSSSEGIFSLFYGDGGLVALIKSNPPQVYFRESIPASNSTYLKFINGSLELFQTSLGDASSSLAGLPRAFSTQYMRLDSDGRLRVHQWETGPKEVYDVFYRLKYLQKCDYPLACGEYGVCSFLDDGCSCPQSRNGITYFKKSSKGFGCSEAIPLSCGAVENQTFVELENATYFGLNNNITNVELHKCKEACASNCLCKAAFFNQTLYSSRGDCYLTSQVFSLQYLGSKSFNYKSTAFLKVQLLPNGGKKTNRFLQIMWPTLGALLTLVSLTGALIFFLRKKNDPKEIEEDSLNPPSGMLSRFSYKDLITATENFGTKLGEGGFSSVYEGTLSNGTKVAVKCLHGVGHIKDSFLAEVETIGSIHHINLVRMVGFCAEKHHRLLVYEHLPNGSLDKWIFNKTSPFKLSWQHRRRIILDIAKGLNYLHKDCRHKIIHLDIKPQNILLDDKFNAKVSDFGLSKLIDRNQSHVVTALRGTPGYLAPEWLSSIISEKVDIYSFGVVIMEIVCLRKHFDLSEKEEDRHLLSLFQRKAEEGRLSDILYMYNADMKLMHRLEAMKMLLLAAWCLQSDRTKRPSTSMVIKVLEESMEVEKDLVYDFSKPLFMRATARVSSECGECGASHPLLASVLSGPR